MKTKLFALQDRVSGETIILQSNNQELLKRSIKEGMSQKVPLFLKDIDDKAVFELGEVDLESLEITPVAKITQLFPLSLIYQELLRDIAAKRAQLEAAGLAKKDGDEDGGAQSHA